MKLYHKTMPFLYCLFALFFAIFSYALIDPNLTLFSNPHWTNFRNFMVNLGYHQPSLAANIYLFSIVVFFLFHLYFVKNFKNLNWYAILVATAILGVLSYALLSHDIFNYIFDAKIATFYHQNPYLQKALDFPSDPWIRFMHWTHRTYPYGPVFLPLTLIPSFLGLGKFFMNFFLFKLFNFVFFLLGIYLLNKLNKKWAAFFATSPLVLIEGLVNAHNDLIALTLAIIGIYFLYKNKNIVSRVFLILSGGIKYLTFPVVILTKKNKKLNLLALLGVVGIIAYLSFFIEVQPWYFLSILIFLPYYERLIENLNIFFAGLLLSYDPFIRFGGWGNTYAVVTKHRIIILFLAINLIYIFVKRKKLFATK